MRQKLSFWVAVGIDFDACPLTLGLRETPGTNRINLLLGSCYALWVLT